MFLLGKSPRILVPSTPVDHDDSSHTPLHTKAPKRNSANRQRLLLLEESVPSTLPSIPDPPRWQPPAAKKPSSIPQTPESQSHSEQRTSRSPPPPSSLESAARDDFDLENQEEYGMHTPTQRTPKKSSIPILLDGVPLEVKRSSKTLWDFLPSDHPISRKRALQKTSKTAQSHLKARNQEPVEDGSNSSKFILYPDKVYHILKEMVMLENPDDGMHYA